MGKRALSLFLAVLLCVSMLPTAVFADTSGTFETVETITAILKRRKEKPEQTKPPKKPRCRRRKKTARVSQSLRPMKLPFL